MELKIKATHLNLTSELRALVGEKIEKTVEKFFKGQGPGVLYSALLEVELARVTRHHEEGKIWKTEVNLTLPQSNLPLRVEAVSENIKTSIIKVKDELEQELRKYKTKKIDKLRKAARYLKEKIWRLPRF